MAQAEAGHMGPMIGRHRRAHAGLTLIEVLVVLVIIGILATLTISVASRVSSSGKARLTEDAIRILDTALTNYVTAKEAIPSPVVKDPREPNRARYIPVADARNLGRSNPADRTIINTVGLFIYQAETEAGLTGLFAGVDQKILTKYDPDSMDPAFRDSDTGDVDSHINQFGPTTGSGGTPDPEDQPWIPTMLDGWGRPIRYVHPAFSGVFYGPNRLGPSDPTQGIDPGDADNFGDLIPRGHSYAYTKIRRNRQATDAAGPSGEPDSDGGRPVGNRPYFYSAGADGDPSTIDDNLYSVRPEFPS